MSSTPYYDSQIRRGFATIAAGTTDGVLLAAETGKRLRLLALQAIATAATAVTVNRKPSGSGVAIGAPFTSANGEKTIDWQYNPHGWLQTGAGEGLTVTTGAGQSTQFAFVAASVPAPDVLYDETDVLGDLLFEDGQPIFSEG